MRTAEPTPDRADEVSSWDESVLSARFVDRTRAEALTRLDIHTVGDLLHHYPFRYLDLTSVATLRDVKPGTEATVIGRVHEIREKRPRPRLTITEVALVDGTGVVLGVWFNQSWIAQRFVVGERVAFAGKVELEYGLKQIRNPFVERLGTGADESRAGRILPIHRTTEGLTTNWLRRLVAAVVDDFTDVPDHLPASIRDLRGLIPLRSAMRWVHFPTSMSDAQAAHRRLTYDELFLLQCYMAMRRHALTRERAGIRHRIDGPKLGTLRRVIPFGLTSDQQLAVDEVLSDMASPHPMNRMLLGDVGTGKTIVAAHALAAVADSADQAAMMAPTEVLAIQYAEKIGPLLNECGVTWALLVGSTPAAERRGVLEGLSSGSIRIVFGTHALLEPSVSFARLTLAIVDEQHRFGVGQRLGLRGKGASADLLVMTATPIPRSLALTLYGDLDTSYLRERPHGLGPEHVSTRVVKPTRREDAYREVRRAVREGRQAYVVCALVDESDAASAKAATREAERLRTQVFSDLRVRLLTGRMKPSEKAAVMREFRDGKVDVLVSTTVIEVGVDVPNATVMIVEDAERFGLAQLHQLRGRIGRGEHAGTFLLFADAKTSESRERMEAIQATNDGFELAEYDLRLRGEGHILGDRQHGIPPLRLASVLTDAPLIAQARDDAAALVDADPHFTHPEHVPLLRVVKRAFAEAWDWVSSG